ncbi:MAG: metal-dependent hydrolase [Planctomycetota bacterium]
MASIVGHALGAAAVWEAGRRAAPDWIPGERRLTWIPVAAGILPDADVLALLLFPSQAIGHRGPSHSLLAAVGIAALLAAAAAWRDRGLSFRRVFALLLPCAFVHPVLDYLMAKGPPIAFLWPFVTEGWLSPVQLVPTAFYATTAGGLAGVVFHWKTWVGIGFELASLGPLYVAARAAAGSRLRWGLASAASFALIYLVYDADVFRR